MKKRQRKKRHVGEFQELGFEVSIWLREGTSKDEHNTLFESFISNAIEANGLVCGGGGGLNTLQFFVTSAKRRGSATEDQQLSLQGWLAAQSGILRFQIGPLVDAWYGWK